MDIVTSAMQETASLLRQITDDPAGAADQLEAMAARLVEAAAQLRMRASTNSIRSEQGIGDRVQMIVRGPNGEIKQQTDTRNINHG